MSRRSRTSRVRELLPLAFLVVTGCRSVTDYEPVALPPGPQRLPNAPVAPDPPPDPDGPTITLREAIDEALRRSPDLRAAAETVVQARADLKTASLLPNPQLTAGTSLQPLPGSHFTPQNPGGPPQYNFDLSQALDPLIFGKRSAAITSGRRAVDAAGADLADFQRRRTADVAAAFVDILESRALRELARVDLDSLRKVEAMTRQRVELGGSAPVDLDRAKLDVASAAEDLRSAETASVAALATLTSLIGRNAGDPSLEVSGSLDVANPRESPDLQAVLADAEAARPDLASLRRQVQHWEAEARSQRRQALPSLALQLGYLYQNQQPVGGPNQSEWEGSVSMSLPLFDRNQGNVAKAESQARQAQAQLDAARVTLRAELAQAIAALWAAHEGIAAGDREQLEAAQRLKDRMQAAYEAGGRKLLEVLDAERAHRDALRRHIHVHAAYRRALYDLYAASAVPATRWETDEQEVAP
jgi:outer membrane protein, heavy metal efflux system